MDACAPLPAERRRALFSGHVQGVGFRFTTREIAERYAVTGFVQNLPDGRVELVAEGAPDELDRFMKAIGDRLGDYIRRTQVDVTPAGGEFADFRIRR